MSDLKSIASIVFIGLFIYLLKTNYTSPKSIFHFIWQCLVAAIVAAVFTLPAIGVISGLLFGWTGN